MACTRGHAQVFKRGARPLGGGEVMLKVPIMKQLPAINLVDEGEWLIGNMWCAWMCVHESVCA